MSASERRTQERTLRRLFLMLFLRGRSARALASGSTRAKVAAFDVGKRLRMILIFYGMFGLIGLGMIRQPTYVIATYLHAMTFVLLGMYVATSAGEVLFNKEEADILMHRPIEPRVLLRARIGMLVQVSLWLAGAFNLTGMFVGAFAPDGSWLFPAVHALSVGLESLFTTATVIVVYQLCLRWFGREKLDAFMTATQVIVAVVMVLAGQVVPQLLIRMEGLKLVTVHHWWNVLLPPAWFAGFDDAIAGSGSGSAWGLAAIAVAVTALVVWTALVRLAGDYQSGLQTIAESATSRTRAGRRRWAERLASLPPLRWWLRDPVARASFLLVAAYIARDRDVKLRLWPSVAPMMVIPLVAILPAISGKTSSLDFGLGIGSSYLALTPMMALTTLTLSQQWQATDVFRLVPIAGPASLCDGARRATLLFVALPVMLGYCAVVLLVGGSLTQLAWVLPGFILLPVYAMIPCLQGQAIPLSQAPDAYKATSRTFYLVGAMVAAVVVGAVAGIAREAGFFGVFLGMEFVLAIVVYLTMRRTARTARWETATLS